MYNPPPSNQDPFPPATPPPPQPPAPGTTYVTPPQPPAPAKNNRVWLYVLIGLAVACVLCLGVIGITGLVGGNIFRQMAPTLQVQLTQVAPTLEAAATQAVQQQPQPAQPQPGALSPYITDVILATQTQGDNLDPVNPTTVFQPSDTIHAVAQVENVPDGTNFKIIWYAEDVGSAAQPNTKIAEYELTASGTRNLDFTLAPNNEWPEGLYRAELFVNSAADRVIRFTVKK